MLQYTFHFTCGFDMKKFAQCQSEACFSLNGSVWHIFKSDTQCQPEACFRMAHVSEWHAIHKQYNKKRAYHSQRQQMSSMFLGFSMQMSTVDQGLKFSNFLKDFKNSNFQYHTWIQHEKWIKMRRNKPSIGPVVFEIVLCRI